MSEAQHGLVGVERTPRATIVVPAFQEEARLAVGLPRLAAHAVRLGAEVLVVDDGSTDATATTAAAILRRRSAGSVLRLPVNAGKGAAVRAGVAAARGASVVFMDADLATDLDDLPGLLDGLRTHDIVIGSRRAAGSVVSDHASRRGLGLGFNALVTALTGLPYGDTQCGFKAFRADAAKQLFALSTTDGFAFDVEVLLLAWRLGMRIDERPVRWQAMAGSKVSRLRDPLRMAADVVRVARRWSGDRPLVAAAHLAAYGTTTSIDLTQVSPAPAALAFT
jgi:glycosyltransferase involved in cell wall biosynthesis